MEATYIRTVVIFSLLALLVSHGFYSFHGAIFHFPKDCIFSIQLARRTNKTLKTCTLGQNICLDKVLGLVCFQRCSQQHLCPGRWLSTSVIVACEITTHAWKQSSPSVNIEILSHSPFPLILKDQTFSATFRICLTRAWNKQTNKTPKQGPLSIIISNCSTVSWS